MTTAKDLFIIAMDPVPDHAVGQGDLSLALAGAELLDLIGAGVITVDGDLIVPGGSPAPDDRLLGEAAARITGQPPYERIEDWLWRRGRDLAAAYQDALEEDGELTQKRSGRIALRSQARGAGRYARPPPGRRAPGGGGTRPGRPRVGRGHRRRTVRRRRAPPRRRDGDDRGRHRP